MAKYKCVVCEFIYDEDKENTGWDDLPDTWACPVCESTKKYYKIVDDSPAAAKAPISSVAETDDLRRTSDELESYMADIHQMAETGESVSEPMRTKKPILSWDDILIKGAQLARIPLNHDEPVNTQTVIGPGAKHPLTIDTPIYITHMSFGALSKEAKIALARGSHAVKTAMCSRRRHFAGILGKCLQIYF